MGVVCYPEVEMVRGKWAGAGGTVQGMMRWVSQNERWVEAGP